MQRFEFWKGNFKEKRSSPSIRIGDTLFEILKVLISKTNSSRLIWTEISLIQTLTLLIYKQNVSLGIIFL